MATIGSLTANLSLQTAAFQRDLGAATRAVNSNTAQMRMAMRKVEQASRNVQRQFSQLRGAAVALAGALAVRQFAKFTQSAIDNASAIQDTADVIGLTTDQLQEFSFAAAQTGVGVNDLETSLRAMQRRAGEALSGNKTFAKGFKDLGVTIQDLASLGPAALFERIADGVAGMTAQTQRIAALDKVFSETGRKLVVLLQDGGVGLQEFARQAQEFGAVMSSRVIAQAKIAGDNLTVLQQVFRTSFDTALIKQFADGLILSRNALEAVREAGENFGNAVGAAMSGVAEAARLVADNMRTLSALVAGFIAFKVAAIFGAMAIATWKFAAALRGAATAGAVLTTVMRLNPLAVAFALVTTAVIAFSGSTRTAAEAATRHQEAITALNSALGLSGPQFDIAIKSAEELARADILAAKAQLQLLDALIASQQIGLIGTDPATSGQLAAVEVLRKRIEETQQAIERLGQAGAQSADRQIATQTSAASAVEKTTMALAQQFSEINGLRQATEQGAEAVHQHTIELETHKALIDAELIPATQTLIVTQKLLAETNDVQIRSIYAIVAAIEDQKNAIKSLAEAEGLIKSVQTGYEERIALQKRLNELVEEGALTQAQATMIWMRTLDRAKAELSEVNKAADRTKDFARDMGLTFSSAFEDAVVSGNRTREMLRGLEQDILRILTRNIITEPAGNLFEKLIGQAVAGLGGLIGGAPMTPTGFVQGGGSAFAKGGSFMVGGGGGPDSQQVKFMATPGERVTIETPGQQSRGGIQVTIINNAGAEVSTRESSSGGGVSLEVTLDKAVARALRKPGSDTSRAMAETFGARRSLASR